MQYLQLLGLLVLGGCQIAAQADHEALLLNPTPQVQEEARSAIARMLNKPRVLINIAELTRHSILPVERVALKDADGLRMQGLELEEPHFFKLVQYADKCYLVLLKSPQRELLPSAQCKPA